MTDKIIFSNLNSDVKKLIEKGDFKHWQVAMQCGVSRQTLTEWLRSPLTKTRRERILNAIKILQS